MHVAGAVRRPGPDAGAGGRAGGDGAGASGRADPPRGPHAREPGRVDFRTGSRSSCRESGAGQAARRRRRRRGRRAAAPVHLSTATVEQLDAIDGIGPTLAERIIEFRDENGGSPVTRRAVRGRRNRRAAPRHAARSTAAVTRACPGADVRRLAAARPLHLGVGSFASRPRALDRVAPRRARRGGVRADRPARPPAARPRRRVREPGAHGRRHRGRPARCSRRTGRSRPRRPRARPSCAPRDTSARLCVRLVGRGRGGRRQALRRPAADAGRALDTPSAARDDRGRAGSRPAG